GQKNAFHETMRLSQGVALGCAIRAPSGPKERLVRHALSSKTRSDGAMSAGKPSERSIFLAALELPTPGERTAYVRAACGDDRDLRAAVEALLAAHERPENILDAPPVAPGEPPLTAAYQPITEGVGTVIGPYKLLQQIGEGGFGVVFMAEQQE